MAYWLMKSEPDVFGIDHLEKRPQQTEPWSGVRNYQVRNMMRDQMKVGDEAFFYHSSCDVPGIYGLMTIVSPAYPDPTQFDPRSEYYDKGSRRAEPRWLMVDVKFKRKLAEPITLATLRQNEKKLQGLRLLAPGNRLSVVPVSPAHWKAILSMA